MPARDKGINRCLLWKLFRIVWRRARLIDRPQRFFESPGARRLQAAALQPVHRVDLIAIPVRRLLEQGPAAALQLRLVLRFSAPGLIQGLTGQRHDVEGIEGDTPAMRRFAQIGGLADVPDETTILNFRRLLETHGLAKKLFQQVNAHLQRKGLSLRSGTIVDATIINAPSSTKNQDGERDPAMHQAKQQCFIGDACGVPIEGFDEAPMLALDQAKRSDQSLALIREPRAATSTSSDGFATSGEPARTFMVSTASHADS